MLSEGTPLILRLLKLSICIIGLANDLNPLLQALPHCVKYGQVVSVHSEKLSESLRKVLLQLESTTATVTIADSEAASDLFL